MTIHPVWYCALCLLAVGMAGMVLGSRDKPVEVRRDRLRKTFSYLMIVSALLWIGLQSAPLTVYAGISIVAGGSIELVRAIYRSSSHSPAIRRFELASLVVYVLIAVGFIMFLGRSSGDRNSALFLEVFCFDAFSQVTGQMIGRRHLAPRISPKKTVEGFLGGLAAAVVAGWLSLLWHTDSRWLTRAVLTVFGCLAGDLAGSYFKRMHGLKDFSDWIPYQGGFLDRFGSLMVACAVNGMIA